MVKGFTLQFSGDVVKGFTLQCSGDVVKGFIPAVVIMVKGLTPKTACSGDVVKGLISG